MSTLRKLLKKTSTRASAPSTSRPALENFETMGDDRQWAQLMMYSQILHMVKDVPGDIAEFGVASGVSFKALVRLNNVYNSLRVNKNAKKNVYGFDVFTGLPSIDEEKDLPSDDRLRPPEMKKGGFNSSATYQQVREFVENHEHCEIFEGLFEDTIPLFLREVKHASFSLLHIDCDTYSSTSQVLQSLMTRLNVGGVILFDEIFHPRFPGETKAFQDIYSTLKKQDPGFAIEFHSVASMPWKWYGIRKS